MAKAPGFEDVRDTELPARATRFGETSPSMRDAQTAYQAFLGKRAGGGKPWSDLEDEERAAWAAAAAAVAKTTGPGSGDQPPRGRVSDTGELTPEERQKRNEEKIQANQKRAAERFREHPPTEPRHWERNPDQQQRHPDPSATHRGPPVGPPMPADPSLMHTPLSPPGSLSQPQERAYEPHQAVSPGGDHIPAEPRAPNVNVPTNQPKRGR